MDIRFWGVRGSVAVSGAPYVEVGGNTPCVELICEGHRLILDGGTGLRALAASLGPGPARDTALVFSHVHWDHIQGVPFFAPLFHPGSQVHILGADRPSGTVRDALAAQMRPPRFPIGIDAFRGQLQFTDVADHEPVQVGPFRLRSVDLHHPDGVRAWRVEAQGQAVVYATDVEHFGEPDPRLIALAQGADALIHDAQYTTAEYTGRHGPGRRGWGHATVDEAVHVAQRAGVERLLLFHHDPARTDAQVNRLEADARERFAATQAAREGQHLAL